MPEITVVGGGPAGSMVASILSKDHDVLVLEDHPVSGMPAHCTGLVSENVIRMSGVRPQILNRLRGANVIFPSGRSISIKSEETKAVLIDRTKMDVLMAEAALDAGALFSYSTKYNSHSVRDGKVRTVTSERTIESDIIIGADGHNSAIASTIPRNRPTEYVRGIQFDIEHKMDLDDIIDIRIGSNVAPGFFSWEIPYGDLTRIGLCVSESASPPINFLKLLLRSRGLEEKKIVKRSCGMIPLGGRRRSYSERLLLIGDAAGQVKPISGGGLYPTFKSARHLADTVNNAFEEHDFSSRSMSSYEKAWTLDIGRELSTGYRLRKMYTSMSDRDLNKVCDTIGDPDILSLLKETDIDDPSKIIKKVMFKPSVISNVLPLLIKYGFRGLI